MATVLNIRTERFSILSSTFLGQNGLHMPHIPKTESRGATQGVAALGRGASGPNRPRYVAGKPPRSQGVKDATRSRHSARWRPDRHAHDSAGSPQEKSL
jgi:hypothetical protein